MAKKEPGVMDKLTSLAKQRGFIFQSSEIYGGLASTWDYGPLGVELKRNIKNRWWRDMVTARDNVVGMDAAILMHPDVWKASGHVDMFHDIMVDNKLTKKRYRLDHLLESDDHIGEPLQNIAAALAVNIEADEDTINVTIPRVLAAIIEKGDFDINGYGIIDRANTSDGFKADWTPPREFNLMFKTFIGPTESEDNIAYLRPETAQGIFVNFLNVQQSARQKLPFGIAQMGKSFRNEVTTGNFIFRTREFEQMEIEYFVAPGETAKWLEYWTEQRLNWFESLGITPAKLRIRPHGADELAHYSAACNDIEYQFPFGWGELEGIADRGDYDLRMHQEHSGKKLTIFDSKTNQAILPAVVESSAGVDRTLLTVLTDAYHEEEVGGEKRVVLKLLPSIAPITAALLPLVKKDGMPEVAKKIMDDLRGNYPIFYDESGSIGKRYRRQDEAGTPFCITVDGETLSDETVTIRERDTMAQDRVGIAEIDKYLGEKMR